MSSLADQVEQEQKEHEEGQTDTVEGMAENGEGQEDEPLSGLQIPIEGLSGSITMTPGGARAQTATVHLRGGKLPVEGEFKKGDIITLYVQAVVGEVHYVDTHGKGNEVTGTERKHIAKPIAVRRMSAVEG